jgi:hypothetical protein
MGQVAGNTDAFTERVCDLKAHFGAKGLLAQHIRISPTAHHGAPCIRIALYGPSVPPPISKIPKIPKTPRAQHEYIGTHGAQRVLKVPGIPAATAISDTDTDATDHDTSAGTATATATGAASGAAAEMGPEVPCVEYVLSEGSARTCMDGWQDRTGWDHS